MGGIEQLVREALKEDMATCLTAVGADFDEVIGIGDDIEMVFDDDDGVAEVDQLVEELEEALAIVQMQADGGFFEQVEIWLNGAGFAFPE